MTKTVRLNDAQLVLLSQAANNQTGALLPLPASLQSDEDQIAKELKSLLRRKLIEEREVAPGAEDWRCDSDIAFGLFLTDKGSKAIGIDDEMGTVEADSDAASDTAQSDDASPLNTAGLSGASSPPRPGSKIGAVITLLERKQGATLDELIDATDWQPHTTRAALTGLRKRGYTIAKAKRDDVTCYRIGGEA